MYDESVSKWLSQFLEQENLNLVAFEVDLEARKIKDMKKNYQINVKPTDETIYSDYSQFLLMSESSLADLNKKTPTPVSYKNFRPNIMIDGREIYAEVNEQLILLM